MSEQHKLPDKENIEFGGYQFFFDNNTLKFRGKIVDLQHKPSEILAILLRSPGQIVTRDQIIEAIWGDQIVDFDQNINFNIKCIRKALNDDPRRSIFIQTVPRKGYRFIADTQVIYESALTSRSINLVNRRLFYLLPLVLIVGLMYYFQPRHQSQAQNTQDVNDSNEDLKRAQYLLAKGDYLSVKRSIDIFERVTHTLTDSAETFAGLSIANLINPSTPETQKSAVEYAQRAYQKDPQNGQVNLAMAMIEFYVRWDMPKAQFFLEQATHLSPQSIRAWHELSVVQTIRGDYKKASYSIQKAIEIDPGRFQEIFHAGWFHLAIGEYDKALDQCLKSLEIAPNHRYSLLCVISAALKQNLNQTAIKYMIQYIELYDIPANEVDVLKTQIKQNPGQEFYQWYLQFLQQNKASNFQLALTYAQLNNTAAALLSLEEAIENRHMMVPTAWAFGEFIELRKSSKFVQLMEVVTR